MKNSNKNAKKPVQKTEPESGIIVVCSGNEPGIYRFVSSSQRKTILKENAENRCREFKTEEISKAEEYLQRALDEAEARKFPIGYIAVRSGQFKGVYPYISEDERLKHMNRYHKYEIRDFAHYHFRRMAEIWADGFSAEEVVLKRTPAHKHLRKIFSSGNPGQFRGIVTAVDHGNISFEKLDVISEGETAYEENICIYNTELASEAAVGSELTFSAEVYEYITDDNYSEYGIYQLF